MLTPASMPVTAGKNTARTTQNPSDSRGGAPVNSILVCSTGLPK